MANGSTISDLVGDGRGKWTILTVAVMILASGISYWISAEGRDYTDRRIEAAIAARNALSDVRYAGLRGDIDRLEREFARVWAEMARRIERDTLEGAEEDMNRRLDELNRQLDRLEQRLYGRGSPP